MIFFTEKFTVILKLCNNELDTVKKIYDEGKEHGIPFNKYYPPVAGAFQWLSNLRKRIEKPIKLFQALESDIVKSEEGMHVLDKADHFFEIIDKEHNKLFKEWCDRIPGDIKLNMDKNQLIELESGCFALNFDDVLQAALREVKYMKQMDIQDIPEEALAIFNKIENLMAGVMKLNRIVEWFNYLIQSTTTYEFDLINEEVETIKSQMLLVADVHTWYTNGEYSMFIFPYIVFLHLL